MFTLKQDQAANDKLSSLFKIFIKWKKERQLISV